MSFLNGQINSTEWICLSSRKIMTRRASNNFILLSILVWSAAAGRRAASKYPISATYNFRPSFMHLNMTMFSILNISPFRSVCGAEESGEQCCSGAVLWCCAGGAVRGRSAARHCFPLQLQTLPPNSGQCSGHNKTEGTGPGVR